MTVKAARAGVIGLGATGMSCLRYLRRMGYEVVVFDTRRDPPALAQAMREFPDLQFVTGPIDASRLAHFEFLAVSPGVPLAEPGLREIGRQGMPLIGDVELFARATRRPVLAITGANGKSTVTSLAGRICAESGLRTVTAGNIGLPVLDALADDVTDIYVIELSSFQLETTSSLNATAATVLNISPDHMDRYASLADYAAAKARIFEGDGVMVLNRDDPVVSAMARAGRTMTTFSLGPPVGANYGVVEHRGEPWLAAGTERFMKCRDIPLIGRHNWANVLAAVALARVAGVPLEAARRAILGFRGLAHRSEIVAEADGILWINDSKGTNVGATAAALAGMTRPVLLIAGGIGKDADFSLLRDAVRKHVHMLLLIGRDAEQIADAIGDLCPVERCGSLEDAVSRARRLARPGDAVLLSPACASFDMFRNFEHRGDVFRAAVRAVVGGGAN
ncbi:MAG: UDP-N-acetylmuramoyl-L-alanine--D-glutamate ligase [Acidiferrobacteraceae bacterium]